MSTIRDERKKNKRIPFNKLETPSPTELDRRAGGELGAAAAAGQNPLHCIIMSMVQAENTATSVTAVETEVAENNENKSLPIQYSSIQHFKLEYLIVYD